LANGKVGHFYHILSSETTKDYEINKEPSTAAHTYNPSYLEVEIGNIEVGDQQRAKSTQDLISTNGWVRRPAPVTLASPGKHK
jgi:hypothetical protein